MVEKSRLQRDWLDPCGLPLTFSTVEKTGRLSFIWSSVAAVDVIVGSANTWWQQW